MKKLTAGIFATILGLTTVNAFAATQDGVASTQYVRGAMTAAETAAKAYTDTKVGTVNMALDGYMKVDAFDTFKIANTAAIKSAADAAQEAATNAATANAEQAATAAETAAKAYTDTKVGTLPQGTADVVTYVNTKTEGIASNSDLEALQGTVDGHTESINNINTALAGKQATITGAQLEALNSGIDATKVSTYDGYAATIADAVSGASAALEDAGQALREAGSAVTAANGAVATAGEAKTAATNAQNAAASAAEVAGGAKTTAEGAVTTANEAKETANAAKTAADTATTNVTNLTTTVSGHTTAISNLQTASETHATKAEVKAVDDKFANYVLLKDVVDEYKPSSNN